MSKPTTRSTKADLRMYLARAERDFAQEATAHKYTVEHFLQRVVDTRTLLAESEQRAQIAEDALRDRAGERLCLLAHYRTSRWYNRFFRW
jgi:hypothetical protein